MANYNYDIIRLEATEANLQATLISGQLGFASDTYVIGHLYQDGVTYKTYAANGGDPSYATLTTTGIATIGTVNDAGSDQDKFLVLDGSNNIDYRTGAELLADLSGDAGASFDWNSQSLVSINDVGCTTLTASGEVEGGSLDINGNGDVSGILTAFSGKSLLPNYDVVVCASGNGDYTDLNLAISTEPADTTFFVCDGTYTLTSNLSMKIGQKIIGESKLNTIIDQNSTTYQILPLADCTIKNVTVLNGRNTGGQIYILSSNNVTIENVLVDSNTVASGLASYCTGIYFSSSNYMFLNNVTCSNWVFNIRFNTCSYGKLQNLGSNGSSTYGFYLTSATYMAMSNIVCISDATAILLRASSYNLLSNIVVYNATTYGITFHVTGTCQYNVITNYTGTVGSGFASFDNNTHTDNSFIGVDIASALTIVANNTKLLGCTIGNITVNASLTGTIISACKFGSLTDNGVNTVITGCDYTTPTNIFNQHNDAVIGSDSLSYKCGAGSDMCINYDGTNGNVDTSLVAPSDLEITCGANKTIELQNVVYDDLQFSVISGKLPVANYPTLEAITTNKNSYSFDVDDYMDLPDNELPHWYKESTNGHPHLHLAIRDAQSTGADRFAKFTIYISLLKSGTGVVWSETPLTAELTIPTGSSAKEGFYLDMGNLDLATGTYNIGSQIGIRVKRIAATGGTEYAANVFVTQCGIHLEKDTMGSRSETSK